MATPSGTGSNRSSNQPFDPSGKVNSFSIVRGDRSCMQRRSAANIAVVSMPG